MRRGGLLAAGLAAALALTGCEEPAVKHSLLLEPLPDGTFGVTIRTTLKERRARKPEDLEPIQRELDAWALGRDAWMRGLARAGADLIRHHVEGPEKEPDAIERRGCLPGASALEELLPDSIAFFSLERGEDGATTLEIRHHDLPERLRDHWRAIDRELDQLAERLLPMARTQCRLFDYIRENRERGTDLIEALRAPEAPAVILSPEETALLERLHEANAWLERYLLPPDPWEPPLISRLDFAPFDFELCVSLPLAPASLEGFVAPGAKRDVETAGPWCLETTGLVEILLAAGAASEPPMLGDEVALEEPDEADPDAWSFACEAPGDEAEVKRRAWDRILPRRSYSLVWRAGEAPTPGPAGPDGAARTPPER